MNAIHIICLLSLFKDSVTGFIDNEGIEYGEFFFKIFPSSVTSTDLDEGEEKTGSVHFRFYKRTSTTFKRSSSLEEDENFHIVTLGDLKRLPKEVNPHIPTMVIITGFMANNNASFTTDLISAARRTGRWNVFLVDWHKLSAGPWYPWAVDNVPAVGRHLAKFLDSLAVAFERSSKGKSFFKNLHVVGYSLGAHVAGVAGHHVTKGKIGRLTGIDPAYPLIDRFESYTERLDASDADFVDVIHTCGGYMGMAEELGHVDFYPNGGTIAQPGCDDLFFQIGCSHRKSWQYFTESIIDPGAFKAKPCGSWEEFETGDCNKYKGIITNMGIGANPKARGKYYLRTNPSPPYSKETI